ncbi:Fic family protein [Candidatus Xianfuyuplasma coldseepsis]|uniref:Fic family protein n=2 Tax=Candidatus Xianfuyuplasma coldseepsis TaxID=2782163 RepID=A0A7L7KT99_9MOLU|nr:Fic family protein [Xianfuyuplasma coldseepsis]
MKKLPFNVNLDTIKILKELNLANNSIGELKGVMNLLPNPNIIFSLLAIGESKDSSAIENIITTYEDIYKEMITKKPISKAAKEVNNYKLAMEVGFNELKEKGFISTNTIIRVQEIIEPNKGGIRRLPGTVIKNMDTNEIVHTPPQSERDIRELLKNLEEYLNNETEYDPLVQLALIHFQFESIHPFYDGNGRTGRILNILYLVLKEKINQPILYLSKYIIENKSEYYDLLKSCNQDITNIEKFVSYILMGVHETSKYTVSMVLRINDLINLTKEAMKDRLSEIYSDEIVLHIFSYLYTKNELFRESLSISRPTATKYLKELEREGFLVSERVGKEVVYKNIQLLNIFK